MSEVNLGKVNTNFLRKRDSTKMCVEYDANFVIIYICEMINVCKNMHSFDKFFSLSEDICFTVLCLFRTSLIP